MHAFNTMEILKTSCECPWSSPKGPCDAISEPKIISRNRTTTMSNVNAAPLEKRTKVELLLPAESVIWIWAQVDRFCDAKTETQKSVNPHNRNNLRWFTNSAEWVADQPFWFFASDARRSEVGIFHERFWVNSIGWIWIWSHIMLLDNVENRKHCCFLGKGL